MNISNQTGDDKLLDIVIGPDIMLRSIAFKNYIHFRDRMELVFENGSSFIIGANSSGKSSIFELIRRCLSAKSSTSPSRIYNFKEVAYAVSKYEIPASSTLYENLQQTIGSTPKEICSYIFSINENSETHEDIHYKFVTIKTDTGFKLFSQNLKTNYDELYNIYGNKKLQNSSDAEKVVRELGELVKSQPQAQRIHTLVTEYFIPDDAQKIERVLEDLTECVVLTLPMRAIGELQWSKSTKIDIQHKSKNYSNALERAEILNVLLDDPCIREGDEEEMFKTLIRPVDYSFGKVEDRGDGRRIQVSNNDSGKPTHPKLLKVSEGLLEAKQLTLLLSHKNYFTLCLEEPDKGMHPQMIEKMRDLILRRVSDKTVLVISHQPSILNTWTMSRTFVCRRKFEQDTDSHRAILHQVIDIKGNANRDENPHFLAEYEIKKILYAANVLAVEGETDCLIIKAVFDRILEGNELFQKKDDLKILQEYVSSLQIIVMGGFKNKTNTEKLCSRLKVPGFFLLDRDVLLKSGDNLGLITFAIGKCLKDCETLKEDSLTALETLQGKLKNIEARKKNIIVNVIDLVRKNAEYARKKVAEREVEEVNFARGKTTRGKKDLEIALDLPNMSEELECLKQKLGEKEAKDVHENFLKEIINKLLELINLRNTTDADKAAYLFHYLLIAPVWSEIKEDKQRTLEAYKLPPDLQFDCMDKKSEESLNEILSNLEMPIFLWNVGRLEDLLNDAIIKNISSNLKVIDIWKETKFPIMGDKAIKKAKSLLRRQGYESEIKHISQCLLDNPEIIRLLQFMIQIARK